MKKILLLILLILLVGCQKRDISVVLNDGYDIIEVGATWVDEGCTLNINTNVSRDMEVYSDLPDLNELGEYDVIYYEEYDNVEYSCKRVVKVVDTTKPVVTLNSGIDTVVLGETWIDAGVTITDNLDSGLTATVIGIVDVDTLNMYLITYSVTDKSMNTTLVSRIVNIIE